MVTATRVGRCLAIALLALLGASAAAPAWATAPVPTAEAEAARAAIARARTAARAKDYAAALHHYQEALRQQPSAKLHFNIGVCHHRLMMAEPPGTPPYEAQRGAAVAAYNRYLQAAPRAPDQADVAEMIRALGGTPLTDDPEPWTIELVEPDAVPDPPSFDEGVAAPASDATPPATGDPATGPATSPATGPATGPPRPHKKLLRGRVGAFVPVVMSNPRQLAQSDELRPLPALGLGVRGNAFVGLRRRIALGGEVALGTQPTSAELRHRLSLGWLGVLVEFRHPLGAAGRLEIGGGGVVGLGSQSLVFTGDTPRLRCAGRGREASRRAGLWAGARLYLAVLLGPRRNHELSLRLGPGLGVFAAGSVPEVDANDQSCAGQPSAFEVLGLPEGASLSATVDIGYAPRF